MFKSEKELFASNLKNYQIAEKLYYYFAGDSDNEVFEKIVQKFSKYNLKITTRTLYNYQKKYHWQREYKNYKDSLITDSQVLINHFNNCINEYLKGEKPMTNILQERGLAYSTFDYYCSNNFGDIGTKWTLAKDTLRKKRAMLTFYNLEQRLSSGIVKESTVQSKFVRKINPKTGEYEIIAKPQRRYDKVKELPPKELLEIALTHFADLMPNKQISQYNEKPIHELTQEEIKQVLQNFDSLDSNETMPEE